MALLAGAPAAAGDALDRIRDAAAAASGASLPSRSMLIAACGSDLPCSARRLADALGEKARLLPVAHPSSDTIRWALTRPSLRVRREDGALRIEVLRFGRKIMPELAAALGPGEAAPAYVLDLRQVQGGRFARMLEVAGFFLGPREKAVALVGAGGTAWLDLPAPAARGPRPAVVRLCGAAPSAGEAALKAVIPVDHDWRLLVERARITVPGADLDGGLRPDRAC